MHRKTMVILLGLLAIPNIVLAWTYTSSMDSYPSIGGGGYCYNRTSPNYGESRTDSTAPDSGNVLHGYMYPGTDNGREPFHCSVSLPTGTREIYFQYYIKFGNNWQWHPTIDKHFYIYGYHPTDGSKVAGAVESRHRSTGKTEIQYASASIFGQGYRYTNVLPAIDIKKGVWYKITGWIYAGTPGGYNGKLKVWVNDTLQLDYTNVPVLADYATHIATASLTPVWGGYVDGLSVPTGGMDLYMDKWTVSSSPISGLQDSDSSTEEKIPNSPTIMNIE